MNNMHCTPDITVGFHPGANRILANFTETFISGKQRASMAQFQKPMCCFGSIERHFSHTAITMFGAMAEDVSEASFFVDACPSPEVKHFSLKVKRVGETTTVAITYHPEISGKVWRVIYGMLLKEIRSAGLKARQTSLDESSAALTLVPAWH